MADDRSPWMQRDVDQLKIERLELEGYESIDPFLQGEFDGLCGLYSVINALRLASYGSIELRRLRAGELFAGGLRFIAKRSKLSHVIANGMSVSLWRDLARHLCKVASTDSYQFSLQRAPSILNIGGCRDKVDWISNTLQEGSPVILLLKGKYQHFTVASAVTSKRLMLCDSSGMQWLQLHGILNDIPSALSTASSIMKVKFCWNA
jgi:hypothetical protein